jgi:hypothetical protein
MNKSCVFLNEILIILCLVIINNELFAQQKLNSSQKINSSITSVQSDSSEIIIDSNLSYAEAISGINIPRAILDQMELLTVQYYGFDGKLHLGQIVLNRNVVQDIKEIFEFIKETKFPVDKVTPISAYNWSDDESMKDNNTSAFNYRFISGSRVISQHAYGNAIDINPLQNPYVKNGKYLPDESSYNINKPGTITPWSGIVKEFKKRGWIWGGDWKSLKDYQHFEKKLK